MWGVALPPSFPSRFSFWDDETKTLGEFNGVLKDRYIGRERERERGTEEFGGSTRGKIVGWKRRGKNEMRREKERGQD